MKRVVIFPLACLLLAAGCTGCKKEGPGGPFGPLATRLPATSDLVVLLDLAETGRSWTELQKETLALPVVAENPGVKQALEEQQALLRTMVAVAKGTLGLDPLEDLQRAAIGVVIVQGGDPGLVVAVEGEFPPDLFARIFPGQKVEEQHGHEVWNIPDSGFQVTLLDGKLLLLADQGRMGAALKAGKADDKFLAAHAGLFAETGGGFLFRVSFVVPDWARTLLEGQKGVFGISTPLGTRQVLVDLGRRLELTVHTTDQRAAENVRYMLEAQGEMLTGSGHLVRGLGFWCMALDLDALPDMPQVAATAFANRKPLLATLEKLFPAPREKPKVVIDGLRVSLEADRLILKGAGLLIGVMAAAAVPAFIEYRKKAAAAGE